MSKKSKSKNSIVKKAKKFQRQGKFEKAIKLCDDYLDNEKLEESIIQIKVDNLSELFYQKSLPEKFNRYANELDYFLDANEEKELLRIYSVFEQLYRQSEDFLSNSKAFNAYLISGILIEPVESIIVMNGIIKENNNQEKKDIPSDLREHVERIKKVSYQYLGLYFENPREDVKNLDIDCEDVFEDIMATVPLELDEDMKKNDLIGDLKEPSEESQETLEPQETEEIIESKEKAETNFNIVDSNQLSPEDRQRIEAEIESLKKQVAEANTENKFNKAYKLQERLIKASKTMNPTGVEIRELKEEIKEANEVENYRKGLKLQKKLLKLSKNQDIINPDVQEKTEQTTLFDDF